MFRGFHLRGWIQVFVANLHCNVAIFPALLQ